MSLSCFRGGRDPSREFMLRTVVAVKFFYDSGTCWLDSVSVEEGGGGSPGLKIPYFFSTFLIVSLGRDVLTLKFQ